MNIQHLFGYALRRIWKNKRTTVFTILIGFISLFLMELVIFCSCIMGYSERNLEHCFYGGIDSAFIIQLLGMGNGADNMSSFLQEVNALPGVRGIGTYGYSVIDISFFTGEDMEMASQIRSTQKEHGFEQEFLNNFEAIETIEAPKCAQGLFHYRLIDGKSPEDWEVSEEVQLLYLGYSFRDIPVGTILTQRLEDGREIEFLVGGIFEQGEYFFDYRTLTGYQAMGTFRWALDNSIVVFRSTCFATNARIVGCVNDGYEVEEVLKQIREIAAKYGFADYMGMSMADHREGLFHHFTSISSNAKPMLVLTILAVCVIYSCMQLINTMNQITEYGVWIANGMTKRDIACILFLENFIKISIACLCAAYSFIWVFHNKIAQTDMAMEFLDVFYVRSMPVTIGMAVFLLILSSILPIAMISRMSTVRIVKGDWR